MSALSEAAERNKGPIAEVLARFLPKSGVVLEIASGTGQHAVFFAQRFPHIVWQPSDVSTESLARISEKISEAGAANCLPPIRLDVLSGAWPIPRAELVFCANMIHIAPAETVPALFSGAARVLPDGGRLVLYGPFFVDDGPNAPSNERFDEWLKSLNPAFGVRSLPAVVRTAAWSGFRLIERVPMPANNLTLALEKTV